MLTGSIATDKDSENYIISEQLSQINALPSVNIFGYSAPYGFFTQVGILCRNIFILTVLTVLSQAKEVKGTFLQSDQSQGDWYLNTQNNG